MVGYQLPDEYESEINQIQFKENAMDSGGFGSEVKILQIILDLGKITIQAVTKIRIRYRRILLLSMNQHSKSPL